MRLHFAACLAGMFLPIAYVPLNGVAAGAQQPPTKLKIVKDKTLSKNLLYWFAAPSVPASAQRPLPQAQPDGSVFVEVPAQYHVPRAQVNVLDPARGVLAHLRIWDTSGQAAGRLLGPNLMENSNFAREGDHWIPEMNGGQAKGQLEWLSASDLPKGVTGKAARVHVTAIDTVNWHVQLHQPGIDLTDFEPYTLTFWARADRARPLSVNATVDKDDYHWIGLSNQVALTTEWRKISLVFTATRTLPNHNRLGFTLGDALGTVDLAGITLQRGVSAGPLGANLLRNSNFNRGGESWLPSVVAPAAAQLKVPSALPSPRDVQGKVAQIEVTDAGMQNWHVQFFQTGIDLTEGQPVTLSFWAKSNRPRPLSIIAGEDKEDYHTVGLDNYAGLDLEWRKFVFVFTPTCTVRNSHRLTFMMGDSKGEVDLAGIALQPGAEAIKEPGSGVEISLNAADFNYSQSVNVPVRYKGRDVQELAVTLKYGDETTTPYYIQSTDHGSAHFSDVPVDEKVTVVVSAGSQSTEFPRIVASDSPDTVAEIAVPDSWTQIKTSSSAAHRQHPLVGSWKTLAGTDAQNYITTFNADGTGTIRRASEVSTSVAAAPPTGAFLWHVKTSDNHVVMSSREYTWSIVGKGKAEKLFLKDANGKLHTLVRR